MAVDKPLAEILRENKAKKQAEFEDQIKAMKIGEILMPGSCDGEVPLRRPRFGIWGQMLGRWLSQCLIVLCQVSASCTTTCAVPCTTLCSQCCVLRVAGLCKRRGHAHALAIRPCWTSHDTVLCQQCRAVLPCAVLCCAQARTCPSVPRSLPGTTVWWAPRDAVPCCASINAMLCCSVPCFAQGRTGP